MATFPTGVVSLTNPSSGTLMSAVSHADQHVKANDEIEAIETALGANLANVLTTSALDIDPTLSANSDVKIATQKAAKAYIDNVVITGGGVPIGYLDADGTLTANSDTKIATQKATKTYVDSKVSTGYGARVGITAGSAYVAATDGEVSGWISDNASGAICSIIVGGDYRHHSESRSGAYPYIAAGSAAVKKGETYIVSLTGVGTGGASFMPLGV